MNLEECQRHINDWYLDDTINLVYLVLTDDEAGPQYSAITALNRLWLYLQLRNGTDPNHACANVASLLTELGYDPEEIALLRQKARAERPIYIGAILDEGFFE